MIFNWDAILEVGGVSGLVFVALVVIIFWVLRSIMKSLNSLLAIFKQQLFEHNKQLVENTKETHNVAVKIESFTQLILQYLLKENESDDNEHTPNKGG